MWLGFQVTHRTWSVLRVKVEQAGSLLMLRLAHSLIFRILATHRMKCRGLTRV
jgi:hypothetical protein